MSGEGPWVARFRDGPALHEPEHVFTVGPIWERIELAPMPATDARPLHWVIIGGDGIGDPPHAGDARSLWPGQIAYQLVEVDESGDEPIAYYGVDLDPPRPLPPYLWPQRAPLGPDDLRVVPSTGELRTIVRLLDQERLAGFTMVTQRDGSPWLEVDVVVPFTLEARDYARREVAHLGPNDDVATVGRGGTYRFALWRYSGSVYRIGGDGAVEDDPIALEDDDPVER